MSSLFSHNLMVGLLGTASLLLTTPAALAHPAPQELCGKYASTEVASGRYIVQNNVWGATTAQCINVDGAGFTVTKAEHDKATNGAPASYPSIYAGCHYEVCTANSGLPLQVSKMGEVTSSWATKSPAEGTYNVSFDLWFDPDPQQPKQNAGELMIWLGHQGGVQPAGSKVASGVRVAGATYDVWTDNDEWNIISYVRTSRVDSVRDLDLTAFAKDAVARGSIENNWYLTSVQAGFEPWKGGRGLSTESFSFSAGTSVPTAEQQHRQEEMRDVDSTVHRRYAY